jgi:hypothetical protein
MDAGFAGFNSAETQLFQTSRNRWQQSLKFMFGLARILKQEKHNRKVDKNMLAKSCSLTAKTQV